VLTERQRDRAFEAIQSRAFWGLGWCDAQEIDQINILQASLIAMARAYEDMTKRFPSVEASWALVDGLHCPALAIPARALVKADASEPCVSAASILAKVARDQFMRKAHAHDPRYGFAIHKGYPTLAHRKALVLYGLGPLHRKTFVWKRP
jgi:ribonuclease HII